MAKNGTKVYEYKGYTFEDNGHGDLYNGEVDKFLVFRPYPMMVQTIIHKDGSVTMNQNKFKENTDKNKGVYEQGYEMNDDGSVFVKEEDVDASIKEESKDNKNTTDTPKDSEERRYRFDFGFKNGSALRDEAFEDAKNYLEEEDMAQYLDEPLKSKIDSLRWVLDDVDAVHVDVVANQPLTDEDMKELKSEIEGQNSDGLGEGFEQQSFAESYYDPDTGEGPYTYQEVLDIVQRNFDNMDFDEYQDYIDSDAIREGLEAYLRDGYYNQSFEDYLLENEDYEELGYDTEEEFREHLEQNSEEELFSEFDESYDSWLEDEEADFLDSGYAEEYIDRNALDNAMDEVARNDPRYNENLWEDGMVSMEWDIPDGVDVTPKQDNGHRLLANGEYLMTREELEADLAADPYRDQYADTSYEGYLRGLNDAGLITDEERDRLLQDEPSNLPAKGYADYNGLMLADQDNYGNYTFNNVEDMEKVAQAVVNDLNRIKLDDDSEYKYRIEDNMIQIYDAAEANYGYDNPDYDKLQSELQKQLGSAIYFEPQDAVAVNLAGIYGPETNDRNDVPGLNEYEQARRNMITQAQKDLSKDSYTKLTDMTAAREMTNDEIANEIEYLKGRDRNDDDLLDRVYNHYTPRIDSDTVSTISSAFNDTNDSHAFGISKAVEKLLANGEIAKVSAGYNGSNEVEIEVNNGKGRLIFNEDGGRLTGDFNYEQLATYQDAIGEYKKYKDDDVSYDFNNTFRFSPNIPKDAERLAPIDPYNPEDEARRIVDNRIQPAINFNDVPRYATRDAAYKAYQNAEITFEEYIDIIRKLKS